jgi:hypothetical protein
VQCQNARDAAIAGASTSHQLLSNALQVTPQSDSQTLKSIQSAQVALSAVHTSVAALALSIGSQKTPNGSDLFNMNKGILATIQAVNTAQKSTTSNQGNTNALGNNSGISMVTAQIALITADGPQIVNQQL